MNIHSKQYQDLKLQGLKQTNSHPFGASKLKNKCSGPRKLQQQQTLFFRGLKKPISLITGGFKQGFEQDKQICCEWLSLIPNNQTNYIDTTKEKYDLKFSFFRSSMMLVCLLSLFLMCLDVHSINLNIRQSSKKT